MMRIQISLGAKEYALAQKRAKSLGISTAAFMRRAIRERLQPANTPPWMRYAGLVESGSGVAVDDIVYGSKV